MHRPLPGTGTKFAKEIFSYLSLLPVALVYYIIVFQGDSDDLWLPQKFPPSLKYHSDNVCWLNKICRKLKESTAFVPRFLYLVIVAMQKLIYIPLHNALAWLHKKEISISINQKGRRRRQNWEAKTTANRGRNCPDVRRWVIERAVTL